MFPIEGNGYHIGVMLNHIVQTTTHHLRVKCVIYYIYKSQTHTIMLLHPHSFIVWYRTTTFTKVNRSHSTPLLCRPYYLIDPSWNSILVGVSLQTNWVFFLRKIILSHIYSLCIYTYPHTYIYIYIYV